MKPEFDAVAQFHREQEENIRTMSQDKNTKRIGWLFMDHVTDYKYGYYFTWMGRPIIQHPQDIVALQVDEAIEQKIVVTSCPGGWLRRDK